MNRLELIEKLAAENELTKAATGRFLESLTDTIGAVLKKGDSLQLVGFGTFKTAKRAARVGKNPATGESLKIAAAVVPKFVPGAALKATVDPKGAKAKAAKKEKALAAKPAAKKVAKKTKAK
jgi:DNA-binding protein HU-beta